MGSIDTGFGEHVIAKQVSVHRARSGHSRSLERYRIA
jgi:hypothetical protein